MPQLLPEQRETDKSAEPQLQDEVGDEQQD